jgi:hypothetical protein
MKHTLAALAVLPALLLVSAALQAEETGDAVWPESLTKGKARLVRLKYKGGNWDTDMGKGGDYNLLLKYKEHRGFQIASKTEALSAEELRQLTDDQLPAFMFITGSRGLWLTDDEASALRWYCKEKRGMLFIDNGGGSFHDAVLGLVSKVFPKRKLMDIPNEDPIYRQPFRFPEGAPSLWHHSGNRALGVQMDGRWAVFYHQGDIHDIWKSGHSHPPEWLKDPVKREEVLELAEQGYKAGINVLHYAYTHIEAEQVGADQPATAPESKSEGNEKTKPESEVRPQ